jgi:hypothetical protein
LFTAAIAIDDLDQYRKRRVQSVDNLLRSAGARCGRKAADVDEHDGDLPRIGAGCRAGGQQAVHHLGRNVLAEQVGDEIAGGRRRDTCFELSPQLHADRAGKNAAGKNDGTPRNEKRRRQHRVADGCSCGGMKQREGEQLGGCHETGESRKPEIETQGRENDEDEIKKWRNKAQGRRCSHVAHVRNEQEAGQAGFDERVYITPHLRNIEIAFQLPGDEREHPRFEQDKPPKAGPYVEDGEVPLPNTIQDRRRDHV